MCPEPRLIQRLIEQLRRADAAAAFIAGGEALALVLTEGAARPVWVDLLADAMVGSLLRLQHDRMSQATAEERVRLAASATVLSLYRPRIARRCDAARGMWIRFGLGSPRGAAPILALWTLLALLDDDQDQAVEATHGLQDTKGSGAMVLHDWVVGRVQGHGPRREEACLSHLTRALRAGPPQPALLVIGALVVTERLGERRTAALARLAEVQPTPMPARRRA